MNMTKLDEKHDPSIERGMVILETGCDALSWRHILEPAEEKRRVFTDEFSCFLVILTISF